MPEKLIAEIKVRVTETLERDLMRLAAQDDRSFMEYVRLALMDHAYGRSRTIRQTTPAPQTLSWGADDLKGPL